MTRTAGRPAGLALALLLGLLPAAAGAGWTRGETSLSHLDREAFARRLYPLERLLAPQPAGQRYEPRGYPRENTHLDWRHNGGDFVTGVRNQGDCGCCWDFVATAVMESAYLIATGDGGGHDLDYSEQHVLSCLDDHGYPGGCGTGSPWHVFEFARERGMVAEACLPYMADDTLPCGQFVVDPGHAYTFFDEHGTVTFAEVDYELIRDALHNAGPLTAAMAVHESFRDYTGGIYMAEGPIVGGHDVTLIGYDSEEEYWICKNSWGEGWGMNGFFLLSWHSPSYFGTVTRYARFDTLGPPRAFMDIAPSRPVIEVPVSFRDRSLPVAPDLGLELQAWNWDFDGDGRWDAEGPGPHEFAYPEAGVYEPRLRVTDSAGHSGETVASLSVGLPGLTEPVGGSLRLFAPWPNPFNGKVRIAFDLPDGGRPLRLSILDAQGRRLRLLAERDYPPGRHSLSWDGRDEAGRRQTSGLYLCRLEAGGAARTRRLVLIQ